MRENQKVEHRRTLTEKRERERDRERQKDESKERMQSPHTSTVGQVELMYIFSKSNLEMPEVRHSIYNGSTAGNLIGPIQVESFQDLPWQTTFEEKKKMLGSFRVAVGGPTDGGDTTARPQFKNSELKYKKHGEAESCDGEYEPFNFHALPCDYYKDMLSTWNPKCIIDLTASDLAAAFVAIELKLPYLGVMFSEKHLTEGYKHIAEMTFRAMAVESSPLYDAKLAKLLNPGGTEPTRGGRGGQQPEEKEGDEEKDVLQGQQPSEQQNGNANEGQGGSNSPKKKKLRTTGGNPSGSSSGNGNQTSLDQLMNQIKVLRGSAK